MIRFDRVGKTYKLRGGGRRTVLAETSFSILPGQSIGICGLNGAGKTTLLRLIAGVEKPSSGTIERGMRVSWPIGYASSFQSSLTGADNVRFIARVYRRPVGEVLKQLEAQDVIGGYALGAEYPELGDALLVCATETKTTADIERYAACLRESLQASQAA